MRSLLVSCITLSLLLTAWWGSESSSKPMDESWTEVTSNVLRSVGTSAGYAIVDGETAMLIGAAREMNLEALKSRGITRIDACLLTHHHRDSTASAADFLKAGIRVRAGKGSAEWLAPEGVRQFWRTSLPIVPADRAPVLRDRSLGIFAYLMQPEGIDGIEFDLEPGQVLRWHGWTITAVSTPGHSRDHTAYVAKRTERDLPILFCGDAFSTPGKMWTPYTLDWDHWTDTGMKAAAESLRTLAALKPGLICPEHGPPLSGVESIAAALDQAAQRLDSAGFLKSFERFTKERLGSPPEYAFLAKDQVATAGEKPWTRLSEHLFLSGNTYVLSSRDGGLLLVDPFGPQLAENITRLRRNEKLGPVEVVLISHAHNDHYTGAFQLPERNQWEVWTLDAVAKPISTPFSICAPYVDTRALEVNRVLKDGESVNWREYRFKVGHFPGQTWFTMGLQTVIDGKNCYFTADNFFHADQFSGSGGWSGRNRAWPLLYAQSAQNVLDAAPEWVLAEHGGAFVFSAEDFRRRVQWSRETARVMDDLSPTGQHRHDWNPARISIEPLLQRVKLNQNVKAELVLENALPHPITARVVLQDRGILAPYEKQFSIGAGQIMRHEFQSKLIKDLPPGRHVFSLTVDGESDQGEATEDPSDVFLVVETSIPG